MAAFECGYSMQLDDALNLVIWWSNHFLWDAFSIDPSGLQSKRTKLLLQAQATLEPINLYYIRTIHLHCISVIAYPPIVWQAKRCILLTKLSFFVVWSFEATLHWECIKIKEAVVSPLWPFDASRVRWPTGSQKSTKWLPFLYRFFFSQSRVSSQLS